jgi:hypothetical protein
VTSMVERVADALVRHSQDMGYRYSSDMYVEYLARAEVAIAAIFAALPDTPSRVEINPYADEQPNDGMHGSMQMEDER